MHHRDVCRRKFLRLLSSTIHAARTRAATAHPISYPPPLSTDIWSCVYHTYGVAQVWVTIPLTARSKTPNGGDFNATAE